MKRYYSTYFGGRGGHVFVCLFCCDLWGFGVLLGFRGGLLVPLLRRKGFVGAFVYVERVSRLAFEISIPNAGALVSCLFWVEGVQVARNPQTLNPEPCNRPWP